jgi:hypothetical protein
MPVDFSKLDVTLSDFDWLRLRYSTSAADQAQWRELSAAAEALGRRNTVNAQRAVRERGLKLSYRGDGCFGSEACEWVVRTDRVAERFSSWGEFNAAWREAMPVVRGYLAAVAQGENQVRLLTGTGAVDKELKARSARDQMLRSSLSSGNLRLTSPALSAFRLAIGLHISRTDRSNTEWLSRLVERAGWPTSPGVTPEGRAAAWLLVVHARHDPAFRLRALDAVGRADQDGRITLADMATKTDHILSEVTGLQRYGTKGDCIAGRFVPAPSEKPEVVPRLRREVGLPTLEEQAEMMRPACSP